MAAAAWGGAAVGATSNRDPLAALLQAAMAMPILVMPMRAGAVEAGEAGLSVLYYRERGLMKVTEPVGWARLQLAGGWEVNASAVVDVVTGASPQVVSNASGTPVQSLTGASINDRRRGGDLKIAKRIGEVTLAASRTRSDEEDYRSRAYGLEARWDVNDRLTTLQAGYGKANDRVRSVVDPTLDERRDTQDYLLGVTQVLSPVAVVQSSVQASRGRGWYSDPYKLTLTFYPEGGLPVLVADSRPDHRESLAWLTRYRHRYPGTAGTLQAEYRYFRDDWGVRAHALELAWSQDLGSDWALRPALRYATQSAASFYSPTVARPTPALHSSDQRMGAFGSLSPSLRLSRRYDSGLVVEGTLGYYHNAAGLRAGGSGSAAFETLRAYYVLASLVHAF